MCKTIKEPFFFFLSLLVLTYEKESSHSRFPIVQTRNRFLTAPLSCSLSLSPQKGHISNMLCSFEADGRLKVSVFCSAARCDVVFRYKPVCLCVPVETLFKYTY